MSELRENIKDIQANSPTPAETLQKVTRAKSLEVVKRWDSYPGRNMKGVASFQTRYGEARIGGVRYVQDDEKLDSVEVWVGEQAGNPTYRLINPPTLVPDPAGEVVLVEKDHLRKKDVIRRYRVDPLHAIAEFVASQNGKGEQG